MTKLGLCSDDAGTHRTASCFQRYIAQALGTFFGGWVRSLFAALDAVDKSVERQHHKKVDRCCGKEKGYCRVHKIAVQKLASIDGNYSVRKVRHLCDRANERSDDVFDQGIYQRAKAGADDDTYRQLDDVTAQYKLLKAL
ncbi:MAG: hypothetical protein JWO43_108 [Candidatus Adlerbacteria bacterium]|nr:hypothetical protein [Candidatus Adlerbacteria bacterium]